MTESDETILPMPETEPEEINPPAAETESEDPAVTERVQEEPELPETFTTVQGKSVRLVGTYQPHTPALIIYSTSKMQGNVLLNPVLEDPSGFLTEAISMLGDGFLEDSDGNELDSLVLPIDGVDLSPELRGLIVDCDLRRYTNGFTGLLNTPTDPMAGPVSLANVLHVLQSLLRTLKHLHEKGYDWQVMDGHQFFFNAEYGVFRLVYDGIGIGQGDESLSNDRDSQLNKSAAFLILFLLTGSRPEGGEDGLLKLPDQADIALWDPDTNDFSGSPEAEDIWQSLSAGLRKALYDSCFAEPKSEISLETWECLLQEALDEVEKCVYCGADVFKTASHCLHCGKSTDKSVLLTRWSVRKANLPEFRISFGRGVPMPGELFLPSGGVSPFIRVMYNAKVNALGVRNLSSIPWHVVKNAAAEDLQPGEVTVLDKDMTIEFEGYAGSGIRFLGYEI